MPEPETSTQIMDASQARREWSQLLSQVSRREARVVVEEDGVAVAAIVSPQDLEDIHQMEKQRRRDLATLRASQEGFAGEPADEVEREIAQALAEVRAARAATNDSASPSQ